MQPAAWLSSVRRLLSPGDEVLDWLVGAFTDGPSTMRVGLLCLTSQQVLFYRRKLVGREAITWAIPHIADASVGDYGGVSGPRGATAALTVRLDSGAILCMSFISRGNPHAFAAQLRELTAQGGLEV